MEKENWVDRRHHKMFIRNIKFCTYIQIIMLYMLNLYNVICQFYINKTRKKEHFVTRLKCTYANIAGNYEFS